MRPWYVQRVFTLIDIYGDELPFDRHIKVEPGMVDGVEMAIVKTDAATYAIDANLELFQVSEGVN